jgi:hypothetical protein
LRWGVRPERSLTQIPGIPIQPLARQQKQREWVVGARAEQSTKETTEDKMKSTE